MAKKYLAIFKKSVLVSSDAEELQKMRKALNLHYVNDEACNHSVDGILVGKYDTHPNAKVLLDSHQKAGMATRVVVEFGLNEDGSLDAIRIVAEPSVAAKAKRKRL